MDAPGYTSNHDIIKTLSQRLREYRLAARLSQRELAERSGVGLATISHFEQGTMLNLTLSNLISLLRVIGMEQRVEELLPQLPMHPDTLRQINKLTPKRVRRGK